MERDFTDVKLNELLSCIYKENDDLKGYISGIGTTYSHYGTPLGLDIFTNLINSYLKMLIDRNNKAINRLKSIFADARAADYQYRPMFANYREGLAIYKDFIVSMAETVNPSKTILDVDTLKNKIKDLNLRKDENIKNIAIGILVASKASGIAISEADKKILDEYADDIFKREKAGETLTQSEIDFLKGYAAAIIAGKKSGEAYSEKDKEYLKEYLDYLGGNRKTGNDIKTLNKDDRDWVVKVFEEAYPGSSAKLNEFFEGMRNDKKYDYSEDINNIKYIVYTADKDYRSVFFRYLGDVTIAEYNYNGDDQYYDIGANKLYLRFHSGKSNEGLIDPRGPYATFFHEFGHGIDDVAYNDILFFDEKFMTQDFKVKGGKIVFQDAAGQDVRDNVKTSVMLYAKANKYTISETIITKITDAIMEFGNKGFKDRSIEDKIYDGVIAKYTSAFGSGTGKQATVYCGISDVYGGFTDNKLKGTWGHSNEKGYWNSEDGDYTGKQGMELWAETFSRYMTGNEESIKELNSYFPTAIPIMDDALDSLKGEELK